MNYCLVMRTWPEEKRHQVDGEYWCWELVGCTQEFSCLWGDIVCYESIHALIHSFSQPAFAKFILDRVDVSDGAILGPEG